MKVFLQLRHWQLFLISWGPVMLVFILLYTLPMFFVDYLQLWLIVFLAGLMNSFVWVWAIATELQKLTGGNRSRIFNVFFWFPFIYIWAVLGFMLFNLFVRKVQNFFNIEVEIAVMIGLGLISLACIILGLMFIGRLIRGAELSRRPSIKDHLIESCLMLFPPIGLWIIQPRLNRIITNQQY